MIGTRFVKWNFYKIEIAGPLRLEFVEEVELLLRLFFVGRVFYERSNHCFQFIFLSIHNGIKSNGAVFVNFFS